MGSPILYSFLCWMEKPFHDTWKGLSANWLSLHKVWVDLKQVTLVSKQNAVPKSLFIFNFFCLIITASLSAKGDQEGQKRRLPYTQMSFIEMQMIYLRNVKMSARIFNSQAPVSPKLAHRAFFSSHGSALTAIIAGISKTVKNITLEWVKSSISDFWNHCVSLTL